MPDSGAPILGASLDQLRSTRTSVKWQVYGDDVIPAWVAEMDAFACPAVAEAVSAAVSRGDTGYTWIGPYAAAFAGYAHDTWGWEVDPDTIESAPDVMIGILDVLRVLTDDGDAVIVSPPVYNAFYGFLRGYRRRIVEAPLTADGRLDEAAVRIACADAVRSGGRAAYLLANPHNPTGTLHTAAELSMLAQICGEFGVRVVSDEIHAPLVYPGAPFVPYATVPGGEYGITLFSASKAWNLAGLKCGLAIPGAQAVDVLRQVPEVARHGASHIGAIAHTAALVGGRDWLAQLLVELDTNRLHLRDRLAAEAPGVGLRLPEATYLAWLDLRSVGLGDDPATRLRERSGIALSRGLDFGAAGAGFARLNFATSPAVLDEVIDRLVAGIGR